MKINTQDIRKLIKEAIYDRLRMIDEAGDKAALMAKISKIDEDIQEAQQIKSSIPAGLSSYVAPEIVGDMMDQLDASIQELEAKKQELQGQLAEAEKPKKEEKPKAKPAKKKPAAPKKDK